MDKNIGLVSRVERTSDARCDDKVGNKVPESCSVEGLTHGKESVIGRKRDLENSSLESFYCAERSGLNTKKCRKDEPNLVIASAGSGIKFRRRNQQQETTPLSQYHIKSQLPVKRTLSSENQRNIPKCSKIDFSPTVKDDQHPTTPHKSRKLEGEDVEGEVSCSRIAKQQHLQTSERHEASLTVGNSKISKDVAGVIDMLEHKMKRIFHSDTYCEHDEKSTSSYSYTEETVPCQSLVKLPEIYDMIVSRQCADPILGLSNRIREILLQ